ncbi:MAG: glycerol-3-phosphate dehydrogenase [Phycisphaerales bacterium]
MSTTGPTTTGGTTQSGGLGARFMEPAATIEFDLIVVGGGITGCWATLLAAQRGLRVCLVEADDFGSGASRVSHRILHGGFRYLQSLDLPRLRESVVERRHYFREFPELVRPLHCLMPLYGKGLKRPGAMRAAAWTYASLAADQNSGVGAALRLPRGGVVSPARTRELFEKVRSDGLLGSGVWHDGLMRSHARVTMTILRRAAALGAIGLNHTPATALLTEGGRVAGVRVEHAGLPREIRAPRVLNTAGTDAGRWAPELEDGDGRLVNPAMAFNLMLDRPPVSTHGVAVDPPTPERDGETRTYFLVPRSGRIAAGTTHRPVEPDSQGLSGDGLGVTNGLIQRMLDDLNAAVPGLDVTHRDVMRVDAGLVPADEPGRDEPSDRPIVRDHGKLGGPIGLATAVTVKYTTARHTAARGLDTLLGSRSQGSRSQGSPSPGSNRSFPEVQTEIPLELLLNPEPSADDLVAQSRSILALCEAEGVSSLTDLVLGRTEWGEIPSHALGLAEPLAELLGSQYDWDAARKRLELESLAHALPGSLPKIGEELTTLGEDSAP